MTDAVLVLAAVLATCHKARKYLKMALHTVQGRVRPKVLPFRPSP